MNLQALRYLLEILTLHLEVWFRIQIPVKWDKLTFLTILKRKQISGIGFTAFAGLRSRCSLRLEPFENISTALLYPQKSPLRKLEGFFVNMAEKEGFEPSIRDKPYTPLAGERLQPLGHFSNQDILFSRRKDTSA